LLASSRAISAAENENCENSVVKISSFLLGPVSPCFLRACRRNRTWRRAQSHVRRVPAFYQICARKNPTVLGLACKHSHLGFCPLTRSSPTHLVHRAALRRPAPQTVQCKMHRRSNLMETLWLRSITPRNLLHFLEAHFAGAWGICARLNCLARGSSPLTTKSLSANPV
jgi:hypothetical protein